MTRDDVNGGGGGALFQIRIAKKVIKTRFVAGNEGAVLSYVHQNREEGHLWNRFAASVGASFTPTSRRCTSSGCCHWLPIFAILLSRNFLNGYRNRISLHFRIIPIRLTIDFFDRINSQNDIFNGFLCTVGSQQGIKRIWISCNQL